MTTQNYQTIIKLAANQLIAVVNSYTYFHST